MSERDALIAGFLRANGWDSATRRRLGGDASFRRYDRLDAGTRRAVLMDAPPPHEDVRPFVAIARHLTGLGYAAPKIGAVDAENGLLLLEDFGDSTYTRVLAAEPDREAALYGLAVDLLIDLHGKPADVAAPPGLPLYDLARLEEEALLFTDWYMPAVLGRPSPDAVRAAFTEAWRAPLARAAAPPRTLALRDFHVDNLMWLEGRMGLQACGLLDFQDAVAGPAAYDLVSLIEDARRDIAPALAATMIDRYLAAFPDCDAEAFRARYSILGAQRHTKIIGIFTRLCVRDAKSAYLAHIPRVWRLLEASLTHPDLAPVAAWFDAHVPPAARIVPPDATRMR